MKTNNVGDMKSFGDTERNKTLEWIINCLIEEDFKKEHLTALSHIVGLFNDCRESEAEIFEFANKLYQKYAA